MGRPRPRTDAYALSLGACGDSCVTESCGKGTPYIACGDRNHGLGHLDHDYGSSVVVEKRKLKKKPLGNEGFLFFLVA